MLLSPAIALSSTHPKSFAVRGENTLDVTNTFPVLSILCYNNIPLSSHTIRVIRSKYGPNLKENMAWFCRPLRNLFKHKSPNSTSSTWHNLSCWHQLLTWQTNKWFLLLVSVWHYEQCAYTLTRIKQKASSYSIKCKAFSLSNAKKTNRLMSNDEAQKRERERMLTCWHQQNHLEWFPAFQTSASFHLRTYDLIPPDAADQINRHPENK